MVEVGLELRSLWHQSHGIMQHIPYCHETENTKYLTRVRQPTRSNKPVPRSRAFPVFWEKSLLCVQWEKGFTELVGLELDLGEREALNHVLIYQWLFIKCLLRVRHCRQCAWWGHSLGGRNVEEQKAALADWPLGLRWGKMADKAEQTGRETTRGDLGVFLHHSLRTTSSWGKILNIPMGS